MKLHRLLVAGLGASVLSLPLYAADQAPKPAPVAKPQAATTAVTASSVAPNGGGVDLMQCFQKADKRDTQWLAALSAYKADRETKSMGRSRLLPTVTARVRASENNYKSNAPQIVAKDGPTDFRNCQPPNGDPTVGCFFSELAGLRIADGTNSDFSAEDYQLSASQPLFQMENWYDYQTGKSMARKAKADLAAARQALLVRVGEGYFKVLKAQDDDRFVALEGQAIDQQARLSRRAYEQGIASETEYLETQVAVDSFMADREAAQGLLTAERQNYAAVVGEVIPKLAPLSEDVPIEMPQPSTAEEWVQQARAHNAKVLAAEDAVKVAEYDHQKAKAGHYPRVQAVANYIKSDMHGGQGFTPASELTSVGVELQIPIYSGGYVSASRRQKLYSADKARDMALSQQVLVETTVNNLFTLVTAEMRRVNYRKRAVVTSNNALRATRKSYDDGARTILDLLQAQNHYYREQRELAHSRYEYLINTLKLKEAAGTLSEDDLKALNAWLIR